MQFLALISSALNTKPLTIFDIIYVSIILGLVLTIYLSYMRRQQKKYPATTKTRAVHMSELLSEKQYRLVLPHILHVLYTFNHGQRFTASEVHKQVNAIHYQDHSFGKRLIKLTLYRMANEGTLNRFPIYNGTSFAGYEFSWSKRK